MGLEHILAVQAVGDALGVPYESKPPTSDPELAMSGGGLGNYPPGEYSDDTQMAVALARAATLADLRTEAGLGVVAEQFAHWVRSNPPDIGIQTAAATRGRRSKNGVLAGMRDAALGYHQRHPRTSAGNGALMRTAVLAALPHTREQIAAVAAAVASITHADPRCAQSCVLWTEAVRLAGTTGELDVAAGLDLLDGDSAAQWEEWIDQSHSPGSSDGGGYTVTCLQRAWWSVSSTDSTPAALETVIRMGGDTDTVAAVTGGLCGALRGLSGIPDRWLTVHGWPDMDLGRLIELNQQVASNRSAAPTVRPGRGASKLFARLGRGPRHATPSR